MYEYIQRLYKNLSNKEWRSLTSENEKTASIITILFENNRCLFERTVLHYCNMTNVG